MEKYDFSEGMEAQSASFERQQTSQREINNLGENLNRLKARLVAQVEDTEREVDEGEHSPHEFAEYRDSLDECKRTLLKAFSEWSKVMGSEADPSVGSEVASLEISAARLIDRLEDILGQSYSEPGNNVQSSKSKIRTVSKVVKSKTKSVSEDFTPKGDPCPIPQGGVEVDYSALPTDQLDISEYAKGLASAQPPRSSKKGSRKTASGTTSKSSNAAKLQAKLEETQARVRVEFQQEASKRAQRVLARDIAKAHREQQRRADEELEELENERRRREEELENEQRRREEELKRHQRIRAERLQEELEERRQRMADEAEEEEAATRRLAAEAKAKLLAIEQFDQELKGSERGELESHLPSEPEVGAIDKVTAYVEQLKGNSDNGPEQQNPRGGTVVDEEEVQIPSTQGVLNFKANKLRVELKDSSRAVSFHSVTPSKSIRENFPTCSAHPVSLSTSDSLQISPWFLFETMPPTSRNQTVTQDKANFEYKLKKIRTRQLKISGHVHGRGSISNSQALGSTPGWGKRNSMQWSQLYKTRVKTPHDRSRKKTALVD